MIQLYSTNNPKFISTVRVIYNDPLGQKRASSSSYWRLEDNYRGADDGRGGVGPRTTHFYPQKVAFVREK